MFEPSALVTDAATLRRAACAPGAGEKEWLLYADALAALGFATRAAEARRRGGIDDPPVAPVRPMASSGADRADVRVYVSSGQARPDEADSAGLARWIGARDYSYGFAMRGFVQGLEQIGLPHEILPDPAAIADVRHRSPAACPIHLGFYPPERLRLLKGAYNIICLAWEFDRLRSPAETTSPHAFADQARMLALPDELWVPSRHGAAAIGRSVATPIRVVPAPILGDVRRNARSGLPQAERIKERAGGLDRIPWQPLAMLPRAQGEMDARSARHRLPLGAIMAGQDNAGRPPAVFVTVLNVHDYRKQIRPMLEGFAAFARSHPDALLLVKATTPATGAELNGLLLAEQIIAAGERSRPLVSGRIWLTDAVLTRDEMTRLYDLAAFYLCTSHAEGQNLPLLEAMTRGVVPVTVDHTAMADYISADNAVIVASHRRPFDSRLSLRYGMYGVETYYTEGADVRAAIGEAMALGQSGYAAQSAGALAAVRDRFGAAALLAALRETIATVRTRTATHG